MATVLLTGSTIRQVTYKSIMQLCEAEHSQKDYPDDQDRIPKLIKNAVGPMPFDRFEQLKRTTAFQYVAFDGITRLALGIESLAFG